MLKVLIEQEDDPRRLLYFYNKDPKQIPIKAVNILATRYLDMWKAKKLPTLILVTNQYCMSGCRGVVKVLAALPNVVIIGADVPATAVGAVVPYTFSSKLPSKLGRFDMPIHVSKRNPK